ncbi:PPOX class probable F420-dependent enzyme [Jatrophihabitans sp. GAS493]|uniref:PPOX class F420-dependent oxidoreductase n=1 Tax=Jatrophihabitans sp. GAS493 TaxID=1907575 RepID=UPI000BB73D34|nr:PPOX class F420-dependent oxidoreductase [Jatrophihabitans sp. GAS493]SOD73004.1 PPOX class probable F420-dependent enzyme [Jatrophihabitans sp. GAS493]
MFNDAARALLESNAIAQLITINGDGSPQVSGVWIALDGDELVVASLPKRIKVRNVERDPRVALVVQSPTKSERGLDEYLVVHGTASVTEGGGPELLQQLARTYMGPDVVFPGPGAPPGYIFHITPNKVLGEGNWSS